MSSREQEPVIAYEVRDLLKNLSDDMRRRFEELSAKLDDRVTVGVFNALRNDLDNAVRRLIDAEAEIDDLQEAGRAEALAREVAATTLARETERRRLEAEAIRRERAAALETPVRAWTIRSSKANVAYVLVALAAIVYGLFRAYLALKGVGVYG